MSKLTPLQKALQQPKPLSICCNNRANRTVIKEADYCGISGKMILPIHLDTDRIGQCNARFKPLNR